MNDDKHKRRQTEQAVGVPYEMIPRISKEEWESIEVISDELIDDVPQIEEVIDDNYTVFACTRGAVSEFCARASFEIDGQGYVLLQSQVDESYLTIARYYQDAFGAIRLEAFTDRSEWDDAIAEADFIVEDIIDPVPQDQLFILGDIKVSLEFELPGTEISYIQAEWFELRNMQD